MQTEPQTLVEVRAPLEQEGTQATLHVWLKQEGDALDANQPLLELETDKVTVEIAAPCRCVLVEQVAAAGARVNPGDVIARLRCLDEAELVPQPAASEPPAVIEKQASERRFSPAVRRLLSESGLDPRSIPGTGRDGRLTREDVAAVIARRDCRAPPDKQRIPHDGMRRRIAEHMARSLAVAPHVTAVFEADFSAVIAHRAAHQAAFKRQGASLTITAYLVAASVQAMQAAPRVNSRFHDDFLELFADVNVGIGTALGEGELIVPVIQRAQTLSLFGIAQRLHDLTSRARSRKLTASDMQAGTFSISNHGVSGSLVAAPIIINQPQSAILGVGKLEKRVVVRMVGGFDTIQIRPMAFVSLSIDHRVLDGAQTNAWLTRFVETLETWPAETA